jgi:transposase InsO family protein
LFFDTLTGLVFVFPAESRGQAGLALQTYIKNYGKPQIIIHDNASEFVDGEFAQICTENHIAQQRSTPYEPNQNPVEPYMDIITSMARSMLFVSGLNPSTFWEAAMQHAAYLQIRSALPGRCTPYELSFGRRPNVINLRIFGYEALSYVEKDKRSKFQPKVERTLFLGMSPDHSHDTYKLLKLQNNKIIFRRNVFFNERTFPARKMKLPNSLTSIDTGEDLIDHEFDDDGFRWTITKTGMDDEDAVLYYTNNETGAEERSSVQEGRTWYNPTQLIQATNQIRPTRKGFINTLAETSFKTIQQYDLTLPPNATKPTSFKKAGNDPLPQWFRAEDKERNGFLEFDTWERLDQTQITSAIRQRALRCHHLYDIKRDQTAKNRVVVNGSRQHSDTYTDTTSPVASQLQLRLFLAVSAYRKYKMVQLSLPGLDCTISHTTSPPTPFTHPANSVLPFPVTTTATLGPLTGIALSPLAQPLPTTAANASMS